MVDDNLGYYSKLVSLANEHVFHKLHQLGLAKYIKADTVLQYASLHKLLMGSPHEPHSYLAENSVKALGLRLNINQKDEKTKTLIEDFAK